MNDASQIIHRRNLHWSEIVKELVGELARPFAIWATALTTAWAIVDPTVDTNKLTAAGFILVALYGAKAIENQQQGSQAAKVEIAKAASPTSVDPVS